MSGTRLRIENLTHGVALAERAERAGGLLSRGRGLMGRRDWSDSDGLVLERCNSIHTFFMRMPIDVVYLDRDGRVLRADAAVRPWRVGPIVWRAKRVLELPTGALAASRTRVGDRLVVTAPVDAGPGAPRPAGAEAAGAG